MLKDSDIQVVYARDVANHLGELVQMPKEKLQKMVICIDTNVICDHPWEVMHLVRSGANIKVSAVVIDELEAWLRAPRDVVALADELNRRKGTTVRVEQANNKSLIAELESIAPLTFKRYAYKFLLPHMGLIWQNISRGRIDVTAFINHAVTGWWRTFKAGYLAELRCDWQKVWDDETQMKGDFFSVFEAMVRIMDGLRTVAGISEKAVLDAIDRKFNKDSRNDVLIAAHYLEQAHSAREVITFLSKDQDLRQLIRLHAAKFGAKY
ncbi:MAG: hypothetical protein ABIH41_03305 [Nanoarchaeota archaeon]